MSSFIISFRAIGKLHLQTVKVTGVAKALEENAEKPNTESKGVKAHFGLDDSGLLSITSVESTFEKTITVEEQEEEWNKEQEKKKKKDAEKAASGDDTSKEGTDSAAGDAADGDKDKDGAWANLGDTISSFFNKGKEGLLPQNTLKRKLSLLTKETALERLTFRLVGFSLFCSEFAISWKMWGQQLT